MEAHRKETEATKHVHFKEGVLRMSEAYAELGHKTSILFEAQATVAINMPDTVELEGEPNSGSSNHQIFITTTFTLCSLC